VAIHETQLATFLTPASVGVTRDRLYGIPAEVGIQFPQGCQ